MCDYGELCRRIWPQVAIGVGGLTRVIRRGFSDALDFSALVHVLLHCELGTWEDWQKICFAQHEGCIMARNCCASNNEAILGMEPPPSCNLQQVLVGVALLLCQQSCPPATVGLCHMIPTYLGTSDARALLPVDTFQLLGSS